MASISEQIAAVERAAMNLRADIARMKDMARIHKGDTALIQMRESFLEDLMAAHKTMLWVAANEEKIRAALSRPQVLVSSKTTKG